MTDDLHETNGPKDSNNNVKPIKKNRFHKLYLDMLPSAELYEKSYAHRNVVTHTSVAKNDFIITSSTDGNVKFWKKLPIGIENVKHFRAHMRMFSTFINFR